MKHWTESEINLIKENARLGITYKESADQLNRSSKAVQLKMGKLGFVFSDFCKKEQKLCKQCADPIKNCNSFCSQSCAAKYNNPRRKRKDHGVCITCGETLKGKLGKKYCSRKCQKDFEYQIWIEDWKNGRKRGWKGKTMQISNAVRRYLLEKFGDKCSKCNWSEIHPVTQKVPLEVNHIDGDASNCAESNLELLCPNCHALTPNFRALNKGSKRNRKNGSGGGI